MSTLDFSSLTNPSAILGIEKRQVLIGGEAN